MTVVTLEGCTPEPLAHYLKALGVLRIVSTQKDPTVKGWWEKGLFHLDSALDPETLVRFWLSEYRPTPIVAPWNKGSGFHGGVTTKGRDAIRANSDVRFQGYRETIESILKWPELPALRTHDTAKPGLVEAARNRLSPEAVEWIDASVEVARDGTLLYPPMLGSGGNEGRLDYTNAFMERIAEVLLGELSIEESEDLVRNALFAESAHGLVIASVGQHDPGRAGGYNQGSGAAGIEAKDFSINPWDFILAMEGATAWVGGASRRHDAQVSSMLCSPFTARLVPVGYSSASTRDERASRAAEVWVPIWERPVSYQEMRAFLAEGRADVGGRNAANGIEFAESVASLGVDRGIQEFVRYSLLKRRGESYVAVPVGRFPARYRAESDILRDLHPPLRTLDRFLRDFGKQGPPARFEEARRAIDNALFEVLERGGPQRVKALVLTVGRMERLLAQRSRLNRPRLNAPVKGLRPEWLLSADDGSLEVRLAASLISIEGDRKVGPLRGNLTPLDPEKPWRWAPGEGQRAWVGNYLCDRLASVLQRRLVDAERLGCEVLPLRGAIGLCAEDVTAFINGEVDEGVLEDLLFGFSWVDMWHESAPEIFGELSRRWGVPIRPQPIDATWSSLKLLFVPGPLYTPAGAVSLRPEPSILPLLRAGRVQDAGKVAHRRLFVSGLSPKRVSYPNRRDGPRIAGALLFPVSDLRPLSVSALAPGGG